MFLIAALTVPDWVDQLSRFRLAVARAIVFVVVPADRKQRRWYSRAKSYFAAKSGTCRKSARRLAESRYTVRATSQASWLVIGFKIMSINTGLDNTTRIRYKLTHHFVAILTELMLIFFFLTENTIRLDTKALRHELESVKLSIEWIIEWVGRAEPVVPSLFRGKFPQNVARKSPDGVID